MEVDLVNGRDEAFDELLAVWTDSYVMEAERHNAEILCVISSLGGSAKAYKKDRSRAMKAMIGELYSPPRVTAAAKMMPQFGCTPGFALDLTTCDESGRCWDFDLPEMRKAAWDKIMKEKPYLIIGTPMCSAHGKGTII